VWRTRFEWDERKNRSNQQKHGLSFEEATEAFSDPAQYSVPDRIEDGEQRWQTFGMVRGFLVAMIAHTVSDTDDETVIRIISARFATRHEKRTYEKEAR